MKKILIVFIGLIICCAITVLIGFPLIKLDIVANPYVRTISDWKWWNYLTSHHGGTVLYLHHNWLWIVWVATPGLFLGIGFVIGFLKTWRDRH